MKIGIIGLGSIGERHAKNIQHLFPKAHIEILTKRKTWGEAARRTNLISSSKKFFASKHDIYFVTNETNKHAETLLQCLAQKPRGIFIEKPLSHSLKYIAKIQTVAKKQKTVLVVGYNLQHFSALRELKKLVKSGTIGKIYSMRVFVGQDLRAWRKGDYKKSYSASHARGGGVVLDLVHDLNYPAWLLGEELQLLSGNIGHISNLKISTEDIAESTFSTKKGAVVSIHQDYLATPGRRSCEIVGSKGIIVWEWLLSENKSTIDVYTKSGVRSKIIRHTDRNRMYIDEVQDFMRHVRGKDGYTNLSEAIRDLTNALRIRGNTI